MKLQRVLAVVIVISLLFWDLLFSQHLKIAQLSGVAYLVRKLPDTGQLTSYTSTVGEDADYLINPPSFTVNGNGTVTDNVTGLMWQQTDGGEITVERAMIYCDTLTFAGFLDWRLPTSHELFGIANHDKLNPALDTTYFKKTTAEYWWSSDRQTGDTTKVWVVNAGGGIGPHPKGETISAGGSKLFHVRAVRVSNAAITTSVRYQDNGDSTVTDLMTGLTWQKSKSISTMTWEQALSYSELLYLGGKSDWRLPNIKEIQSLNDENLANPSIDRTYFPGFTAGKFWSSTTQYNASTKAWDIDFAFGIVSYDLKTALLNVLCVRSGTTTVTDTSSEALIPGGEFGMGDHHGFVDPSHPSDELPIHNVKVNSFYLSKTETTNKLSCELLNAAHSKGLIEVRGNCVFLTGGTDTLLYLNAYASYCSIGWNGTTFSIVDFRTNHPIVGIMWNGAVALCNWLSVQYGLQECYNLVTWICDFTKNGYRLPTEAEWEYAGRGGQTNPYYNYPWGDDPDITKANWPESKDPYEGTNEASYPHTTPVGFYDGSLWLKSELNWAGAASSYQTSDGANAFGLYDMAGNVWELLNDWYGNNYYSDSPFDNPKGPESGFIMPDGKVYHGMRGGNWYNGYKTATMTVNDGHSRVSNRNPSYYRGPQDPNHPWYHVGFRFARNFVASTGMDEASDAQMTGYHLEQNYPNPFNPETTITYIVDGASGQPSVVSIKVYDMLGREVAVLVNRMQKPGRYSVQFDAAKLQSGAYFYRLIAGEFQAVRKMVVIK